MQTTSLNEIRREGMKALTERLGYYGTLRFLEQFEIGYGDYTKEREIFHKGLTIDDVAKAIYTKREKKR
ncbi:MAG: hypothetical protein A2X61_11245 [Ignavibacteria bacterium GWB2_35_12]|nr:MAG: hypothetical protein A2X61_11245 [Ignavibacteria bacterium GWB2_35_12]OGU89754.1 MAG: hypothetical protein A2220_02810 [Ignavibacteria bacterium RIFOXYA2_FULL_35_10]OGV24011.1 MAG: hypothetical protein A2475_10890 [Ignavibacteria bacterium RIFOXYC2_FULL_35_21]